MYLSCLLVDVGVNPDRPRPGRLWLRNLYHVHQRLCMAFPSSAQKAEDPLFLKPFDPQGFQHVHGPRNSEQAFLFRIDPQPGGSPVILVQSAIEPNWDYAFQNSPFLTAAPEVKIFNPHFEQDQRLQFRLVANPTKKTGTIKKEERQSCSKDELKNKKGHHGKRVPVPNDQLDKWLTRKAEFSGFRVERFISIQPGYIYVGKSGEPNGNRLFSAKYEGILEVTNPADFQKTLTSGIGPGKAFGFGLLSVAKLK